MIHSLSFSSPSFCHPYLPPEETLSRSSMSRRLIFSANAHSLNSPSSTSIPASLGWIKRPDLGKHSLGDLRNR